MILVFLAAGPASAGAAVTNEAFAIRGYYTTFMRMPTFGLPEWKQMIDAMEKDGANFLILWTVGAFHSKQFPITWKYNADHKNVEKDSRPAGLHALRLRRRESVPARTS
ncbi:MAG TPA: hypothetical protein VK846_12565 [Candidatus Limnocylindria bacterium]|nr:hypothetical protein [Candidatus Limnocylindria bacterium]